MRTRRNVRYGTYRYWIVYDLRAAPRAHAACQAACAGPEARSVAPFCTDLGTTKPHVLRAHQTSGGAPGISPSGREHHDTRAARAWTTSPPPTKTTVARTRQSADDMQDSRGRVVHHVAPAQLYACCAPLRRPSVSSSMAPSRRQTLAATSGVLCRRGAARCAPGASSRSRFARRGGGGVVVRRAASSPPPFA